jgi:hypothetical protein
MKKSAIMILFLVVFGLGILLGGVFVNWSPMPRNWGKPYSARDLLGTIVDNDLRENVGKLDDFIVDTKGRVVFAILSYDDKPVALPFESLTFTPSENHLIAKTTKELMESAPAFDKSPNLNDAAELRRIYRYFGQQPYWTERESGK